jgi:putative FmdB family regulatory protein
MPIYAYRCAACGHAKDVLQRLSDPPLTVCPSCGASAFVKQVTAAGFQLKGSGWYATDFKSAKKAGTGDGAKTDAAKTESAKTDTGKSDVAKPGDSSAAPKSGDSSAPASGGSTAAGDSPGPKAAGGASARR